MSLELVRSRPRALTIHEAHELLLRLADAGFTPEMAQEIIRSKDNHLAKALVRTAQCAGYDISPSMERARSIMGKNYFGPEEAIKHFGVVPTKAQEAALALVPFSDVCLQECRETHLLVAVFPKSIVEIRNSVGEAFVFLSRADEHRYEKQPFARERGKPGWYLVRKEPLRNSLDKKWAQQLMTLGRNEEVPSARILIYAVIGHFLAEKRRLLHDAYVVCADTLEDSNEHIVVGSFDDDGLFVGHNWPERGSESVGLASMRKSDRSDT